MSYSSEPVDVEVRGPNPWLAIVILGTLTGLLGIWLTVSAIAGTKFSLAWIAFLLALGLFLNGLAELSWAPDRRSPAIGYVLGVLFIVGGVVVLIRPGSGLRALAVVLGIVLIAVGLAQTAVAFMGRDELRHWAWIAVFGLLTIAIGVAAIVWPTATVRVLALLFGIRLLVIALGTIGVGMNFKQLAA
ncbi:MAG: DUF308 domain-containing protein [Microthrixaceae bacterium]|nr:DUF308 domain-containing protein [Microthrixaceae bacterium]MCO5316940.1 DUF308 domain-containing protein [Microthrixaceae bacterium]